MSVSSAECSAGAAKRGSAMVSARYAATTIFLTRPRAMSRKARDASTVRGGPAANCGANSLGLVIGPEASFGKKLR